LQHTEKNTPHYGTDVFTFEIGALSTIDRNYLYIIDQLHHHIDYKIPQYRVVRATEILKEVLGDKMYRKSKNSILYDLWDVSKTCQFVDKLDGITKIKKIDIFLNISIKKIKLIYGQFIINMFYFKLSYCSIIWYI
jgi:hypothetical protein